MSLEDETMSILPDISTWSLRRKLISIVMLSSAVCLAITLSVLFAGSAYSRHEESLQALSGLAEVIAENGQAALMFSDQAEASRLLQSLQTHQEIVDAWLIAANGTLLASWSRQQGGVTVEERAPFDYKVGAEQLRSDFWAMRADLSRPVIRSGDKIGYVLLRADYTGMW